VAFSILSLGLAFAFQGRGAHVNRSPLLPPVALHRAPQLDPDKDSNKVSNLFSLNGIIPDFQPPEWSRLSLSPLMNDRFEQQGSSTLLTNDQQKSEQYSMFFPVMYPKEWAEVCPIPRKPGMDPPMLKVAKTNPFKKEMAERLSGWMLDEMNKAGAEVAIVARSGSHLSKTQDKTWMEHSGILIKNSKTNQWEVLNLLYYFCDKSPKCDIWRNKPVDFFYSQRYYHNDALLLLPEKKLQKKLIKGIENGNYKKLQFTNNYNLITGFDSKQSLNCNKWVLMNLIAAEIGDYEPDAVLKKIGETFEPGQVRVFPVLRPIARQHPTILQEEAPLVGPINTVTAESLYRSNRFKQTMFYSGKTV
jgi:hypothetical protein